uniref:ST8 alpha-N-acetyl-neuraminide alpha-2,8-sialyltransferase 6 n=1 Tax=Maylandia zebra TaxID=106582 RepID=A0A3P9ASB2_9CICH
MGQKKDLTATEKSKIVRYLAEGCSSLKIAKLLKRDHRTIKRFIQNSQQGRKKHVEKPRRKITAHELRKVKRAAAKMPLATSLAIFQSCNITGVPKSTRCAILRDMAKVRKAERRPPLNKTHKLKRQDWAKKYLKTDFLRWDTCSVVGNGGILTNSGCGKTIDSTDFVIRCNLPPLENEFKSDVGMKTNLVTANPSILTKKYGSLMARRRAFVDSLHQYGNSLLLFPCFSSGGTRAVCQRAVYAIEDMEIPIQPIFTNPQYLQSMDQFWNSQGVNGLRASTGAYMISLALELCETVHLYGFWPFSNHPYKLFPLTNHYYDNVPYNIHAMPNEFSHWVELHNKGVLKLHLGDCKSDQV